jgi:glutamate racemase
MGACERLPIGVFDSGVGGLTVVREIRRHLPGLDILYFGDTARVPYGNKSPETILRYSLEIGAFLVGQGIGSLVVACNTSSATALGRLGEDFPVPILGMIEPGARMAVSKSRNGRIGIIGTRATVASGAYERAVKALDPGAFVTSAACPLFVPLVEEGWVDGPVTLEVVRRYLGPLLAQGVDTLILGCTHYPVLVPAIEQAAPGVHLVSSAHAAALDLRERLGPGTVPDGKPGDLRVFVTDTGTHFQAMGDLILGEPIPVLEKIEEERLVFHAK